MLSRPTTDQILETIADDLQTIVGPACDDEAAQVTLGMIDQLLRRQARRAAHEIGWMHEETTAIVAALGDDADPGVIAALAALADAPSDRWHLADVQHRYHLASEALSCALEAALAANNQPRAAEIKVLLDLRIANEQEVLGQLDLVGRG